MNRLLDFLKLWAIYFVVMILTVMLVGLMITILEQKYKRKFAHKMAMWNWRRRPKMRLKTMWQVSVSVLEMAVLLMGFVIIALAGILVSLAHGSIFMFPFAVLIGLWGIVWVTIIEEVIVKEVY